MKSKLLKIILAAIGLFLSPFIVIIIVGAIYIAFQMIGGSSYNESYAMLLTGIDHFKPYFPYLTFGPMSLIVIGAIVKKKKSTQK